MTSKLLAILILLISLFYIAFATIDNQFYNSFILQKIQRFALDRKIGLSIEALNWTGWRIDADKVVLKLPTKLAIPIILEADKLSLLIEPYSLLSGNLSAVIHIHAYSGEASLNINNNFLSSSFTISAIAKNIDLSKQQQLNSLDIASGTLSFVITDLQVVSQNAKSNMINIEIHNFNKSEITKLPSYLTKLPLEISIPIIKDLNAKTVLQLDNQLLNISKLEISSNFGDFSSSGNLRLKDNQNINSLALDLQGKLSKDGQNELGSYLMLFSQGQLNSSTSNFKAKVLAFPMKFVVVQ